MQAFIYLPAIMLPNQFIVYLIKGAINSYIIFFIKGVYLYERI